MLCLPSSAAFARDATARLLCFATTDYLYSNVEGRLKPFIYTAGSWSMPKVISSVSLYAKEPLLEGGGGQLLRLIAMHSFLVIVIKKTDFSCWLYCQIFPFLSPCESLQQREIQISELNCDVDFKLLLCQKLKVTSISALCFLFMPA